MPAENLLNKDEQIFLLRLARSVIAAKSMGKEYTPDNFPSDTLNTDMGVFVTLNSNSELRGCIGYVEGIAPLRQAVAEMAQAAAFEDPRFSPVSVEELDDLEIEISVLSPLKEISDISEITVGVHGIIIEKNFYKGLLLPQVATEYGWDRNMFLEHTCVKAGLSKDAWQQDDIIIKIFSAEIFSEKDLIV